MAKRAYAPTSAPIKTARGAEYEVIARITSRLKRAIDTGKTADMAAALLENRELWSTLAVDVADPKNLLEPELRARILYLAKFTLQYSSKVLVDKASAVPLLEINTAILRGLKKSEPTK
ncbi:flagellar biosynthesis regulator FlaF [Sulfitobacter sp. LCG007]